LTIRKFNSVRKDRLFYDQFEYCIGFHLDEATCLRQLDHESIDFTVARRKQWQEIAQQRWVNGSQKHGVFLGRRYRTEITDKTLTDLHTVAEVLLTTSVKYKLVVSVNQGYVYTNDLLLIDQLDVMPELAHKTYTQAWVTRPKNTLQLKNARHEFRTYLKLMKLTTNQKDHLMDFLYNQRNQVRVSPALQRWFDQPFNRVQDYFFVDHNTESWLTMLSLVHPGIIRKTMHIIPAK
jgi:hypothetical protein